MLTLLPGLPDLFNHAAATREGWDVFHCDALPDGERQLQRVDMPEDGEPPFANDRDAWIHVVTRPSDGIPRAYARKTLAISARAGSALHRAALASVDDTERMRIEAACGAW